MRTQMVLNTAGAYYQDGDLERSMLGNFGALTAMSGNDTSGQECERRGCSCQPPAAPPL